MNNKYLGLAAGGLLFGVSSLSQAALLPPDLSGATVLPQYTVGEVVSETVTFSRGGTLRLGVADVAGYSGGDSVLALSNVWVDGTLITNSVELSNGGTVEDCSALTSLFAGDCNYIELTISNNAFVSGVTVTFDWVMSSWDSAVQTVADAFGTSYNVTDFAFYNFYRAADGGAGSGEQSYLGTLGSGAGTVPVPEPSTLAMMLLGMLGVGMAARRSKAQV